MAEIRILGKPDARAIEQLERGAIPTRTD